VNLKILITTMGRVHKQLTYDYMPPALKKQAIIVCPPNEAKDHAALGRNILVCTKDGQGLAKKRDWVLQHAWKQGWRYIAMLDDDVVLQRRRKDMRITNATHDEYPLAFEWLEKQLKAGYAHVGWQHRALAFADTGPAMIGTRQMYCLAYDVKKLEKVEGDVLRRAPAVRVDVRLLHDAPAADGGVAEHRQPGVARRTVQEQRPRRLLDVPHEEDHRGFGAGDREDVPGTSSSCARRRPAGKASRSRVRTARRRRT
jgi:hypothetical protein